MLRTQMSLVCHGGFQHICITPLKALNYSWDAVKHHLQGVWFHNNVSLDLAELQKEIANIGHAQLDVENPATIVSQILDGLHGFNPGNMMKYSFWILIVIFTVLAVLLVGWGVSLFHTG